MTIFGYTWDEIKRAQQGGALARRIPAGIYNRSQPTAIGNCWSATAKPSCGTEVISEYLIGWKTRGWRTTCRTAIAQRAATILCGRATTLIAHPCGPTQS